MLLTSAPADVRATMTVVGAAILLTAVVFGAAITWLRGDSANRQRWTRMGRHVSAGADNTKPSRVILFVTLAGVALLGASWIALTAHPLWWAAICCYDCVLLAIWWATIAINGRRQHARR